MVVNCNHMLHTLPNGEQVRIRPIRSADKAGLQDGLKRLSQETIHRRFLAAKPRFSSAELRYLTEVDGVDHIALAAVSLATGDIVGVARCIRLPDQSDTAEWAIVVDDALQGMGLGRRLGEAIAAEAVKAGIRHFNATMLGDNVAVRRLLLTISDHLERDVSSSGLREVTVALAA